MSDPLKYFFRFILFLFVQAMVLNHIPPLHRFVTPYLYFLFLIWMPFSTGRVALLITGFLLGITLDVFTKTPGLHASATLLVAYLRPFLINLMVPKDTRELAVGSPSIQTMGTASYILFISLLTIFHHGWLVFLEWMTFGSFLFFLGKVFFSAIISLLLILITELIFRPVKKIKRR
ncbi:MAG: rod shape-determining protein MreD [Chitinophagaceae bacterium]|nr:rod shape-determining protein MreD [Chitinophagaceae bacterium]